ncbi:hypothetical protein Caci_0256 [Catenulispora acidiphila DSM 44928]|uniref:Uncharacterized protein n=1 Tax=Catenulispora acidiphila (strain DSM 44928 / JCM 14897 / NBRC 102108 / NRRL B-24433 / ID139908) TaxID=479433 RepID=C7QJ67_CATAD|nr:hypothetical protein [Catenulispora acidiphila]ACU69209.1 hypothetical protein Caci_0256 [Catenulispora acidiphila DSM 44928]
MVVDGGAEGVGDASSVGGGELSVVEAVVEPEADADFEVDVEAAPLLVLLLVLVLVAGFAGDADELLLPHAPRAALSAIAHPAATTVRILTVSGIEFPVLHWSQDGWWTFHLARGLPARAG